VIAMSIIDWLILFFAALAGAIVFLAVLIIVGIIRWWIRGTDEPVRARPHHRRTRLRNREVSGACGACEGGMKQTFWNANRVDVLTTCWAAGETGTSIAEVLGCSRSSVLGKLNRLGLLGKVTRKEFRRRCSAGNLASWQRGERPHTYGVSA
jgi:hypothetical protein